jgi:hypothetical protein
VRFVVAYPCAGERARMGHAADPGQIEQTRLAVPGVPLPPEPGDKLRFFLSLPTVDRRKILMAKQLSADSSEQRS